MFFSVKPILNIPAKFEEKNWLILSNHFHNIALATISINFYTFFFFYYIFLLHKYAYKKICLSSTEGKFYNSKEAEFFCEGL